VEREFKAAAIRLLPPIVDVALIPPQFRLASVGVNHCRSPFNGRI
jgi:hypothetical protein